MKGTTHNIPAYFVNPTHPITVQLIGCGGTGSHLLGKLAQLNHTLIELDHPGITVEVFDGDDVSPANVGRQAYFSSDVGLNKASVLVSRVNRAFGINWIAVPEMYNNTYSARANIAVTCVDSGKERMNIGKVLKEGNERYVPDYQRRYYWLDIGNAQHTGQVVLGTLQAIKQPKKRLKATLPTITEMYPNLATFDHKDQPSCSVRESLLTQDLCINAMMAEWGKKLLWTLFSKVRIEYHGVYVNLETFTSNPIPITI